MFLADRIVNIPFVRKNDSLRTFTVAAWLGWQIESNWADPFLFAVYSFARPVASVLILVVMYNVITDGARDEPIFAYIYLGNALYILVANVINGVSWAVIDDREHYQVAKQLHTMPMDHFSYLMGRGVARLIIGTISVVITIVFGLIAFDLPIRLATIDWPVFLLSTGLGVVSLAALGLIIGAFTLMMARHFWYVGESVAGALYLLTGAIFPLDVLPAWLRPLGFALPVTYWLEVARRALLGPNAATFPTLAGFSNRDLIGILGGFSLVMLVLAWVIYRWAMHRAKDQGLLDMESSY